MLTAVAALAVSAPALQAQSEMDWRWQLKPGETANELVMIFVSATNIPANDDEDFGLRVRTIKHELASAAEERGMTFAAVGVALDVSIVEGVQYLVNGKAPRYPWYPEHDFGRWDEIHVGRSWYNDMVVRHLFRSREDFPDSEFPVAIVPQILVLERTVTDGGSSLTVGPDQLLGRLLASAGRLEEWLSQEDSIERLFDREP